MDRALAFVVGCIAGLAMAAVGLVRVRWPE
jgi:hypothetical protein